MDASRTRRPGVGIVDWIRVDPGRIAAGEAGGNSAAGGIARVQECSRLRVGCDWGKAVRQATSISMKGGTCSTLFNFGGLLADLTDALASNVDLVEATCLHPYIRERVLAEALPL
jgi:hypothetical protein